MAVYVRRNLVYTWQRQCIVDWNRSEITVNDRAMDSSKLAPDIHCHLPEKSQSSTAGNNCAPTSVPLSLGHALYIANKCQCPNMNTKGNAICTKAWTRPQGSRWMRLLEFLDNQNMKVARLSALCTGGLDNVASCWIYISIYLQCTYR
jgi:hypothetical protein